jgi:UDP-GlcNAc:undecaprenyl-phosphate GlcNAc-1-phosphate transferase
MLEIGHSHRRAVLIIWLWTGLVGFGTVLASLYSGPLVFIGLVAWFVLTAALTFVVPRLHGLRTVAAE